MVIFRLSSCFLVIEQHKKIHICDNHSVLELDFNSDSITVPLSKVLYRDIDNY